MVIWFSLSLTINETDPHKTPYPAAPLGRCCVCLGQMFTFSLESCVVMARSADYHTTNATSCSDSPKVDPAAFSVTGHAARLPLKHL